MPEQPFEPDRAIAGTGMGGVMVTGLLLFANEKGDPNGPPERAFTC